MKNARFQILREIPSFLLYTSLSRSNMIMQGWCYVKLFFLIPVCRGRNNHHWITIGDSNIIIRDTKFSIGVPQNFITSQPCSLIGNLKMMIGDPFFG